MKIAEFFIALGFDIKGAPEMQRAREGVAGLDASSVRLLAGVTALNGAFYAMLALAGEVGSGLKKFSVITGQSTDELQKWQAAAVKGDVAARSIVGAIDAIQKAQAAIAFGNSEAAAPWMLLGIDPRQDPFKVLEQLRLKIRTLDPAIGRNIFGQLGLSEDLLFLLRSPDGGGLARSLVVRPEEADSMFRVAAAWRELVFNLKQAGTRLFAQFGPEIEAVLKNISRLLAAGAQLADWLAKGSEGAIAFKYAAIALGVALTGLNIAIGLFALGPFGVFVGLLGSLSVILTGLVVLIQDFWTACKGGKSAFDWNDGLILTVKNVERLAFWMGHVNDMMVALKAHNAKEFFSAGGDFLKPINEMMKYAYGYGFVRDFVKWNWGPGSNGGSSSQTTVGDINVTMQGTTPDWGAAGRQVGRSIMRELSDSLGQSPVPGK